jgi:signal transduction histidine kinase
MQPAIPHPSLYTRFANAAWGLSRRYGRFVLVAMLATLHVAAFRGVADVWARALMLAHLGLVLLWQPFLQGEQRVSPPQALVLAGAAVAVMLWLDWWLLALWVVVLAGLVGGKVYQQQARWQRRSYLVMLAYLLALLAVAILPEIAPRREIGAEVRGYAEVGLPLLFVLIAVLPAEAETPDSAQIIDFFYSIFLMLVLVVVILGSFTLMTLGRTAYLEALTYTVLMIGATVLLVGLAWSPRTGFAGMNVFFARYLFSIGLPPERWLHFLAELSAIEARPERFLAEAVAGLLRLPWVAGVAWRAAGDSGAAGQRTLHVVEFGSSELSLTIYSRYRTSPALQWHLHLLGQLLAEFHVAKLREQKLRQASYLQAVHETGARLTHDIKNLLQSLNVLCSVAARDEGRDSPELGALVRRQLPAITQRLAETMEKLQRPQEAAEKYVPAREWWEALARQYRGEGVEFEAKSLRDESRIPQALFGSAADNLVRNAIAKRAADRATRIRVTLDDADGIALRVRDTGRAVPQELEAVLLRGPVPSSTGLGIGLYQCARLAEESGFALALETNRDGDVCFRLAGAAR